MLRHRAPTRDGHIARRLEAYGCSRAALPQMLSNDLVERPATMARAAARRGPRLPHGPLERVVRHHDAQWNGVLVNSKYCDQAHHQCRDAQG